MDALFYVMAIMGCGDGSDQCTEARIEAPRYATIQACQAAMPAALRRNGDLSFPEISATCRATGVRLADRAPVRNPPRSAS
ncbi:hypothetical protein [Sphingomonas sp. 28-63-12]|uniref:hypothetical protein n=1 Tax=Sphingomonas sp. 28-63-12 TaxID=1970434 RepID=UPI000BCDE70C|nr:MAG: hypothetical protein B7Y47_08950 [Sphingomonas sp. 28-63-12]